jgi:hypothetical protein
MKHNIGKKFEERFVIAATADDLWGNKGKEKFFLIWNPANNGGEYIWVTEKAFREHLEKYPGSNAKPHQYTFESESAAANATIDLLRAHVIDWFHIEPLLLKKPSAVAKK